MMNKWQVLIGVFGVSLLLGSGALAESVGVQPAAAEHPKAHMPREAQTDMKKETPDSASQQQLKQNVEKTDGGGAPIAAEQLGRTTVPTDDHKPGIKKQGY